MQQRIRVCGACGEAYEVLRDYGQGRDFALAIDEQPQKIQLRHTCIRKYEPGVKEEQQC